jgi:hypothetical protein
MSACRSRALRDAEASALAAGDGRSAGPDRGVDSCGQRRDSIVERGGAKRSPEFGLAGGRIGQLQILTDRAVEDVGILGDQRCVRRLAAERSQDG